MKVEEDKLKAMMCVIQGWVAVARLIKAERKVREAHAEHRRDNRELVETEVMEAWGGRRTAECLRLVRRMAKKRTGAQNRMIVAPDKWLPGINEWKEAVEAEPRAGGYSAEVFEFKDMEEGEQHEDFIDTAGDWQYAREVDKEMARMVQRARNRKQPPIGDATAEVWHMLMQHGGGAG